MALKFAISHNNNPEDYKDYNFHIALFELADKMELSALVPGAAIANAENLAYEAEVLLAPGTRLRKVDATVLDMKRKEKTYISDDDTVWGKWYKDNPIMSAGKTTIHRFQILETPS